jgi:hypothetical protein
MTPATAMSIATRGPRRRSAIRSAAYDTDSVDPLESSIGSVTFQVDITQPITSRAAKSAGLGMLSGQSCTNTTAPARMTSDT